MSAKKLFEALLKTFSFPLEEEEKKAILFFLLEVRVNLHRQQILADVATSFTPDDFLNDMWRLNKGEPVQYITGKAWFYGQWFSVTPSVLIPRPETEELIRLVLNEKKEKAVILDVGTGSGCIAVSLAQALPHAAIHALDVSPEAIQVATANAHEKKVSVHFSHVDFLHEKLPEKKFDIIVSNPPYLDPSKKETVPDNVRLYEPALALWASSAWTFYERLASSAYTLRAHGKLLAETMDTHEAAYHQQMENLFLQQGWKSFTWRKNFANRSQFFIAER